MIANASEKNYRYPHSSSCSQCFLSFEQSNCTRTEFCRKWTSEINTFSICKFQLPSISQFSCSSDWMEKKIPCVSAKQLKPYPKLVPTETQQSKRKHLHKFLEGLRMQLYLMPLFFVLVPEISGVFHAEKMSIIIRCIIRYEFLFHFPFKVHFWGGIQEQYDLGNKLPFSTQGIFLMLIMWHVASHKPHFAIYSFAANPDGLWMPTEDIVEQLTFT